MKQIKKVPKFLGILLFGVLLFTNVKLALLTENEVNK